MGYKNYKMKTNKKIIVTFSIIIVFFLSSIISTFAQTTATLNGYKLCKTENVRGSFYDYDCDYGETPIIFTVDYIYIGKKVYSITKAFVADSGVITYECYDEYWVHNHIYVTNTFVGVVIDHNYTLTISIYF